MFNSNGPIPSPNTNNGPIPSPNKNIGTRSPPISRTSSRVIGGVNTSMFNSNGPIPSPNTNIGTRSPPISRTSSPVQTSQVNTSSSSFRNLLKEEAKNRENNGLLDELNNMFEKLELTPNITNGQKES